MKIEIIQGSTHTLTGRGEACTECEEQEKKNPDKVSDLVEDRVSLSGNVPSSHEKNERPVQEERSGEPVSAKKESSQIASRPEAELSEEEKQLLDQLRTKDREVRSHEQAHIAAAGPYAKGPPTYEYQTGPDGKRYAVGGEVQIDTSKVPGNPKATLIKAQTIKRAANAPQNPSAQDRRVAAQAAQMEAEARQELNEIRTEETQNNNQSGNTRNTVSTPNTETQPFSSSQVEYSQPSDNPAGTSASDIPPSTEFTRARSLIGKFQPEPPSHRGHILDIVS